MEPFGVLEGDRIQDVDVRLRAYDLPSLQQIVEAQAAFEAGGRSTDYVAALRAVTPPKLTTAETRRLEAALARLRELQAPSALVERYELALDPVGFAERLLAAGRSAELPSFTDLAARDQLDFPRHSYLFWLLEPRMRSRGARDADPAGASADAADVEGAVDARSLPALALVYGTERLVVAGRDVFPASEYGRRIDANYTAPEHLRARRDAIEAATPRDLFSLRDVWRETFDRHGDIARRLAFMGEEEAAHELAAYRL